MANRVQEDEFVRCLAKLLRSHGDSVLNGTSTLSLLTAGLQLLHSLFEQHLLPRKYQHGFIALPSHPSDTASVLEVQFLFDVLQKTISLKLVHPSGPKLQTSVKIMAFKSLRFLELKRVPPHCLEGLRSVYTRLEILVCSSCINTIEEIISVCGGDLSSALPWLDLHTLNFSNNFITSLDSSLALLSVLRILDLSHNRIQDCAEHLKPLSELEYVNLSYNLLERVPIFSSCSRVQLTTLLLRNNSLENINGVEHLSHLKHLDLAYNIISEHAQLAPLSQLHSLKELFLQGNPVCYQKLHRPCTIHHLSPKAAFMRLILDGDPLTMAELTYLPKTGRLIGHSSRNSTLRSVLESSLISNRSECVYSSDSSARPITRKKSKIKVRTASISEPSDSDKDVQNTPVTSHVVLQHQEDIKRMDELRGQIGDDWLRYQHHLNSPKEEQTYNSEITNAPGKDEADSSSSIFHHNNSLDAASEDSGDPAMGDETTLLALGSSNWDEHASSSYLTPDEGAYLNNSVSLVETQEEQEEEKEETVRDICQPFIVGRLVEEEPELESSWMFLRVTEEQLLEVDLMNADILEKLELSSLTAVHTSEEFWEENNSESCLSRQSRGQALPAVECCFSYIRRDKRKRKYVILDKNPQDASEMLVKILSDALEANQRAMREHFPKLQCLKCQHEFTVSPQERDAAQCLSKQSGVGQTDDPDYLQIESPKAPPACPKCASEIVIVVPSEIETRTSTPIHPEEEAVKVDVLKIAFTGDSATGSLKSIESPSRLSLDAGPGILGDGATGMLGLDPEIYSFAAGKSASFYLECDQSCSSSMRDGSRVSDTSSGDVDPSLGVLDPSAHKAPQVGYSPGVYGGSANQRGSVDSHTDSLTWSYRYGTPVGSAMMPSSPRSESGDSHATTSKEAEFNLSVEDFQTIDHRLKLFLDVEIFSEDREEYQCFVKVSTVKYGNPQEYPSLLILSNFNVYILEITRPLSDQPATWLRKREVHPILSLVHIQVGLRTQSIGMEFDGSGASYTLLIRNPSKCKSFMQFFTDMVRELIPRSISKLESICFTRMDPQHKLWPLVCEHLAADSLEYQCPAYLYALAFLLQDGDLSPVSVVATSTTIYLLVEDHQWKKVMGEMDNPLPHEVPMKESQAISDISSVSLYQSAPHDIQLRFYHEVSRTESTWHLRTECVELVKAVVDWVQEPWKEMFGVPLNITVHQTLD
ncbi:serine/threonine-protein kinase 11-interacting protein isoform X1 [Rhincodon typus]|uniref:serine/threonine-protein kinase 11-interacting protein isoform X1 n=1 Tax=Rhincodon typus TaxID=259920 RepID=UPI00202FE7D6|nr:serine/threonine-protein kinase 11-interacting protein isoform X1 [Rhincodon typus]XP_048455006.1 serine/threonine-protein kinase 11-interacting protein isoform X1 [Rhincodon typus]